jgi:hypothetical protein
MLEFQPTFLHTIYSISGIVLLLFGTLILGKYSYLALQAVVDSIVSGFRSEPFYTLFLLALASFMSSSAALVLLSQ